MKLELTETLRSLDQGDMTLYDRLKPDQRKELEKNISWMIPQWMTGSYNEDDHRNLVFMFDEVCNPGWGSFYGHPELQTKLLAAMGMGTTRHRFFRPTGARRGRTAALMELACMVQEDIREEELALFCRSTDIEELNDLMNDAGVQMDQRKEIETQWQKFRTNPS